MAVDYPSRPRPPMPAGVIVALVAVGLYLLLGLMNLARDDSPGAVVQMGISILFFVFLWRGHPLARQWAMLISVLLLLSTVAVMIPALAEPDERSGLVVLVSVLLAAVPVMIIVGLSPRSSKEYFDLKCPHCGAYRGRAASFLYNRLKCGKCKQAWRLREETVPTQVFD